MNVTTLTITVCSKARRWPELAGFLHDALVDAQHSEAGLAGACPSLSVLLSRRLLKVEGPADQRALRLISAKLQMYGVPHSFHHRASSGDEPSVHEVKITLL